MALKLDTFEIEQASLDSFKIIQNRFNCLSFPGTTTFRLLHHLCHQLPLFDSDEKATKKHQENKTATMTNQEIKITKRIT